MKNKHRNTTLDVLHSPELIGENRKNIEFILFEPVWFKNGAMSKMTDLIIGYRDYVVPIEVKGSSNYRHKALEQIESAKRFSNEVLNLPVWYSKVAYYNNGLIYEVIE